MKHRFLFGIVTGVALLIVTIGLIGANPHGCAPGQTSCKLVQHIVTGKTKCLPLQAVAHPWVVIGDCASEKPAPTDVPTAEPTDWPDLIVPTYSLPTQVEPTKVVPTSVPVTGATPTPTCTPTITIAVGTQEPCDVCFELRRQADALERIADAQETQAARP